MEKTIPVPISWLRGLLKRTMDAKAQNENLIQILTDDGSKEALQALSVIMLFQGYASSVESMLEEDPNP